MRGGLLRGKPPLLFLRSGILAGRGSFLYAESRNKQNWRDAEYRRSRDEMRELLLHKQNVDRMLGKDERSEEKKQEHDRQ